MSRKEGALEKADSNRTHEQKLHDAIYGRKINPEAVSAVAIIWNAALIEKFPKRIPAEHKKAAKAQCVGAWNLVCNKILEACRKEDGLFFRQMADAIERNQNGVDEVRSFVGTHINGARATGQPVPTLSELKRHGEARGIVASHKTWMRACHYFGVKGAQWRKKTMGQ